jgi:hypothetical protein
MRPNTALQNCIDGMGRGRQSLVAIASSALRDLMMARVFEFMIASVLSGKRDMCAFEAAFVLRIGLATPTLAGRESEAASAPETFPFRRLTLLLLPPRLLLLLSPPPPSHMGMPPACLPPPLSHEKNRGGDSTWISHYLPVQTACSQALTRGLDIPSYPYLFSTVFVG